MKGVFGVKYRMGCDHGTKVYRGPGTAPPWPGPTKIPGAMTPGPGPEFVAWAMAPPRPVQTISFGTLATHVPGPKKIHPGKGPDGPGYYGSWRDEFTKMMYYTQR